MRLRSTLALLALLGFTLCRTPEATAEDELYQRYRLALGYHYSAGDYGTSSTTDILYIPLAARAEIGRWSAQLTVPYLRINGSGGFVEGPIGPIQTTSGVSAGLGDILGRGSYLLPSDTAWIPLLEFIGLVKFPTASRSEGLGTGEFDLGIDTEMTWTIDRFMPFAGVGYRYLGSAPGIQLDNVWLGSAGAQYRITDGINGGVLLDYRQAASSTSGQRLDVVPFASFRVRHWSIDVYASAGLADGSPDAGVGMQIGYSISDLF